MVYFMLKYVYWELKNHVQPFDIKHNASVFLYSPFPVFIQQHNIKHNCTRTCLKQFYTFNQ